MTQTIERLQEQHRRFSNAELLADTLGDKGEAAANRVRKLEAERRLKEATRRLDYAHDAARLMIAQALRDGRDDAIAKLCRQGKLSAIHGRAAMILRDVWQGGDTGYSPMASLDAIGKGSASTSGLEASVDTATRSKVAMGKCFEPAMARPRYGKAVKLVVLRGWMPDKAVKFAGIGANARARSNVC